MAERDTDVCPSLGLKEKEEVENAEEDRLLRAMSRGLGNRAKDVLKANADNAQTDFSLYLEGFPAQQGKPFIVVFDGKQVYHSGNLNGNVKTTFKVGLPPLTAQSSPDVKIELKIGVMVSAISK